MIMLLLCTALPLCAQENQAKKQFPGLNLLPVGSVVKGISLPRYDNHRVATHIMADELRVVSAQLVKLRGIRSIMYRLDGNTTVVEMQLADYNFDTEMIVSTVRSTLRNPIFSAEGTAVSFSTLRQQGLLQGPVTTILNTANFSKSAE